MGTDYQDYKLHEGNIQHYDLTRIQGLEKPTSGNTIEERMKALSDRLKYLDEERNAIDEDKAFIHSYSKDQKGLYGIITRIKNSLPYGVFKKSDSILKKIEKKKKEINKIRSHLAEKIKQKEFLEDAQSYFSNAQENFKTAFDVYMEKNNPVLNEMTLKQAKEKLDAVYTIFTNLSSQSSKIRFHENMLHKDTEERLLQGFLEDLLNPKLDIEEFVQRWVKASGSSGPLPLNPLPRGEFERQEVDIMRPSTSHRTPR